MRATTLFILAIFFSLTACGSSKKEAAKAKKPRNLTEQPLIQKGNMFLYPDTLEPYSGPVYELCSESKVVCGEGLLVDGKHDGKTTLWFRNGNKKLESEWRDGELHGKMTSWHKNGQKEKECQFTNHKNDWCKEF